MSTLEFAVLGKPIPQGSTKAYGSRVVASNGHVLAPWRNAIGSAAIGQAILDDLASFTGPVTVSATFYFRRPKHHYGTGKNAGLLRDQAPPYPVGRGCGDLDKLQRAIGDALVDVSILADDSQIVRWRAAKAWCDNALGVMPSPGAVVHVRDLPPP